MSACVQGAVICPSDEDSQTFTVNAANGEVYRLKGECHKFNFFLNFLNLSFDKEVRMPVRS